MPRGRRGRRADLRHLSTTGGSPTAAGSLTARFLALLNSDSVSDYHVSAYADVLCVTPNHLSAVVRQQSGQTVMGLVAALQVLMVQYGGNLFQTVPLSLEVWLRTFALGASVLLFGGIVHTVTRRNRSASSW